MRLEAAEGELEVRDAAVRSLEATLAALQPGAAERSRAGTPSSGASRSEIGDGRGTPASTARAVASGAALAAVLEGNKTITSADLSRNEMGEETMVAVAKMLEKNTGLTHLDVSTNMPGEDGLKAFAGAIAANTTLRVLKLDCSQMKDADAPQFVEALKANTTLKEFTAFQNEVRDRELRKAVKHVVRP